MTCSCQGKHKSRNHTKKRLAAAQKKYDRYLERNATKLEGTNG